MPFDAKAARELAPGKYLTSSEYPGLRLGATASKRTWTYRYRSPLDQQLRQKKIGEWPSISISKAIVAWEALNSMRASGRDPVLEEKAEKEKVPNSKPAAKGSGKKRPTVRDVCDFYWEGHVYPTRTNKSAIDVRRMFDRMLGDTAAMDAETLTRSQAFDLISQWKDGTPVQAMKFRQELAAAWDYSMDAGKLSESASNWWRQVLRRKIKSKGKVLKGVRVGTAKRVLKPEEVGSLLRWLPNFSAVLQDVLTLYLWTGTRGSEIMQMEGHEINQEADGLWWWVIPKAKTKNFRHEHATDLRVPLFGRAQLIVLRRKALFGDGRLFPAKRKDGTPTWMDQKVIHSSVHYHQPYSETRPAHTRPRLPVAHWTPHDLRRTARTLLASLGCGKDVAEAIVGHMRTGVEGIYNLHQYDAERVIWLNKLSDYLEGLASG